ncbi:DUF6868 family protein [candidate division KSB1 bacterium]
MTLEIIREVLGWCAVINMGVLLIGVLFFWLAHDIAYLILGKIFKLSVEKSDEINYAVFQIYRVFLIMFNIVPYIALSIVHNCETKYSDISLSYSI